MLPLLTTYLYEGWLHRPSSIKLRWEWTLMKTDVVSGLIITLVIIISFLSLMSLADFLRFQWQPNGNNQNVNQNRNVNRPRNEDVQENDDLNDLDEQDEEPPPPPEYDFRNLNLHIDDAEIARRRRDSAAVPKREKPSNAVGIMEDGTPYYASDTNAINHADLGIKNTDDLVQHIRARIEESEERRLRDLTERPKQMDQSSHSGNDGEWANEYLKNGDDEDQNDFKDDRKTKKYNQFKFSREDQVKTDPLLLGTDSLDKGERMLNDAKSSSLHIGNDEGERSKSDEINYHEFIERNVMDMTRSPSNSAIRRQREREYLQRTVLDTLQIDDSENDQSNDKKKSPLHAHMRRSNSSSTISNFETDELEDLERMIQMQELEDDDDANPFLKGDGNEDPEIQRMMQIQEQEEEQREDEMRQEGVRNQNPNIENDRNGRFEPQFEPLDPVINQDEEMVSRELLIQH